MPDRAAVLCVDDNAAVRRALRCLLSGEEDLKWAGELETANDLVTEAIRIRPEVILLDIDMPGRPVFQALAELTQKWPDARVVMLSGYMSDELVLEAYEAGASAFLHKNDGPEAILATIRDVVAKPSEANASGVSKNPGS